MSDLINDPMLDLFIFETTQLVEQLEQIVILYEKAGSYSLEGINEIFRIMHTVKGSSAMMLFPNISLLAHAMEDLFFSLRDDKPQYLDYSALSDLVLDGLDFIKIEIAKLKNGDESDGDPSGQINNLRNFLSSFKSPGLIVKEKENQFTQQSYLNDIQSETTSLSQIYQALIFFDHDCGMENIRAFGVLNDLQDLAEVVGHWPGDLDHHDSAKTIKEQGFTVLLKTNSSSEEIQEIILQTLFIRDLQFSRVGDEVFKKLQQCEAILQEERPVKTSNSEEPETNSTLVQQSIINVSVLKLDKLMDLVGEMVIAEAMVTQNPDLKGLDLPNFDKAARQLGKITSELQDIVMSVRMVPLAATFQKMNRIIRDMCKKLNKEVQLKLIGEKTEVDKNIIEHIADPLMHLIRNSMDHGIEMPAEREAKGKPGCGTIILEAKNAGGDVLIIVKDDGKGLNKEKILEKAREKGLIQKPESELSDQEIYNMVFQPGFSTSEDVTEFSGRGVGMDVVLKNIEAIGGSIATESVTGKGITVTLKIPLTLAIIDGMNIKVGDSRYTIPTVAIKESFRPKSADIITDPDNNEMIMVRGQCIPILRLHHIYHVKTKVTNFTEGIFIMVEQDNEILCLFADELLGQQQVVVKTLPMYIKNTKKVIGLAGCTLLGDGSISLILDIAGLIGLKKSA